MVIGVGALIRFYALDKSPPSLGFDEASLGYNAYSIMLTGKDEYGNFLPLSLRSFNDYKPALYAYLSIPFLKLFGLNAFGVRAVSALAGTVSLIFLYLILKEFIKNRWWRLGIFFILSFEPWRLHFSRNAFETNLSSCLFLIGVWFLIKARENKKKWFASIIFFALAAYSYHSARLTAPLLLILWFFDPIKVLTRKNIWLATKKRFIKNWKKIFIFGIFLGLCVPIFVANSGSLVLTRFSQENVFGIFYPYAPKEILNPISSIYYLMGIIFGHIFAYISPINLNQRLYSWIQMSPQFIPGMGMLGWLEGIFLVIGFILVIKNIFKSEKYRFLLYWIIAGIAPAAATWTWYHTLRALNIYPALEILAAIGFWQLVKKFRRKKIVLFLISIILLITIVFTINNELLYSSYENHGEYQPGGYKEGIPYLKSIQDNYDQVIIDTPHAQPFVFLMFYEAMDPVYVQSLAPIRARPGIVGNLTFNFGKFVFRKIDWPKDNNLKKTVFWTSPDITDAEVKRVPGAKIRLKVNNVLYHTADIITTE